MGRGVGASSGTCAEHLEQGEHLGLNYVDSYEKKPKETEMAVWRSIEVIFKHFLNYYYYLFLKYFIFLFPGPDRVSSSLLALRRCFPLCAGIILGLPCVDGVSWLLQVAVTSMHIYVPTKKLVRPYVTFWHVIGLTKK